MAEILRSSISGKYPGNAKSLTSSEGSAYSATNDHRHPHVRPNVARPVFTGITHAGPFKPGAELFFGESGELALHPTNAIRYHLIQVCPVHGMRDTS